MTYEKFIDYVKRNVQYETIYKDSGGKTILVIRLLDAFELANGFYEQRIQNEVD